MANKNKGQQNQDVMKSIFDFIFAETQKPPQKRKPVKISHIDATSEFVDVLTTVLEKPGLYVSDQAMNVLKDTLNIQLAEIYTGTGAPQQKAKIGTTDLVSIFSDPNGYFDKLYEKNKRKMKLADYAGKSFRGILAANTAKKMGIDDWDDRWAINRMAADYDDPAERLAVVTEARKLGRKFLTLDALISGSKEGLGANFDAQKELVVDIGKKLDALNIENAAQLEVFLMNYPGLQDKPQVVHKIIENYTERENHFYNSAYNSLGKAYLQGDNVRPQDLKSFSDWEKMLHKGFKDRLSRFDPENINMGKDITSKYFETKGDLLGYSSDSNERAQAYSYKEMSLFMLNLKKTQDNLLRQKTASLRRAKEYIKAYKALPVLTSSQREQLKNFQKLEKGLKSEIKYLQSSSLQDKYYRTMGYYNSMKEIWGKNLMGSILDGSFFSDKNKILNPINQKELGLHMVGDDSIYFNIPDKDNPYCRTMTTIMYLTPRKLLQLDGTYFAYRTYLNRIDSFNKLVSYAKETQNENFINELYRRIGETNLFTVGPGGKLLINYSAFKNPENVKEAIESLKGFCKDDKDMIAILDKYLDKENSLYKLTSFFSIWARFKDNVKNKIDKATIGKIRASIGERLLARYGGDKVLESAINLWKNGGGIQNLVKAFADKFLMKLGFKGTALTTLSGVLTGALSNFAYGSYIVLIKVLIVAFVGLVFIILMGVSSFKQLTTRYSTISSVQPGSVVQCSGFESEQLVNPEDIEIVVPPPSNSSCPLGSGSFHCSQGPNGSFSHHSISSKRPVDIANGSSFYFYAPRYCSNSKCRITIIHPANLYRCLDHSKPAGEEVYFDDGQGNVFVIVHAKALASINERILGGQAVAYIYGNGELPVGSCWSGAHLHLEIIHNGVYVDPLPFLQQMGCSVPSTSQCTN